MKNTKVLPFERNRYFTGKMLTSSDFQTEQNYVNNKRRFINNMMFGSGIVCGMSVRNLDEATLYVDSGVSIDGMGREIVIPEAYVKKLSTIDGFENIQSNTCRLYVQYDEKKIQPVYSASRKEKDDEYEYNRIVENYKLFLVDEEQDSPLYRAPSEFLSEDILYENDNIRLTMKVPAIVCIGYKTKIKIIIEKLSNESVDISYHALLQFPSFTTADGKHEIEIDMNQVSLSQYESIEKEIWVKVDHSENRETSVIIKGDSVNCTINQIPVSVERDIILKIVSDHIEPRQLINSEIGKISYEMKSAHMDRDSICLAQIQIHKSSNSYEILSVNEKNFKKYIETPADEENRKEFLDYFQTDMISGEDKTVDQIKDIQSGAMQNKGESNLTSGILEIPVGKILKKGEVAFSDEIIHGLGKGNVYVTLGNQITEKNSSLLEDMNVTILGSDDIFSDNYDGAKFDTAVKVLNDKGSFIVGVRAKKDVDCLILKFRWYAMSFMQELDQKNIPITEDKRITVETPTVVLKPEENYFFNVRFNNMEPAQLGYELTEGDAGQISMDGIYTAPNKEGVYEIRIYCLNNPSIRTYAYAIVKRKDQI